MTDGEVEMPPFSAEQIKDDDQAIKFYIGFVTFTHLMACFHFLGLLLQICAIVQRKVIHQ